MLTKELTESITLRNGTRVVKNPGPPALINLLATSSHGKLRGLAVGNDAYWWDAYGGTHGDAAQVLGHDPYVDDRMYLTRLPGYGEIRLEGPESLEWHRVLEHPQLRRVARDHRILFYGGSQGWVSGDELSKLDEVRIDNRHGAGNVPDNQNVDYLGMRVMMRPSRFLALATPLPRDQATSAAGLARHIAGGGSIASPWLIVSIPREWETGDMSKPARIIGHEGRNRMMAVMQEEGDEPIEVHLFFGSGLRARHIQPEWKQELANKLVPQGQSRSRPGPWFAPFAIAETLKKVHGRWALVSRKNPSKVLQYYRGHGHPSKEWVSKVERRVHSFSEAIDSGAALSIFDIDDTLFHTTARVSVVLTNGDRRELTASEFNAYKLKPGESFDFSQFQDARLFHATSRPIETLWRTANNTLANMGKRPGSRVVIMTARQDFDDERLFLDTFRKHGMDMSKVSVFTVGGASNKKPEIAKLLAHGNYTEARLFDDHHQNLFDFLELSQEFPGVTFKAFPVGTGGRVGKPVILKS